MKEAASAQRCARSGVGRLLLFLLGVVFLLPVRVHALSALIEVNEDPWYTDRKFFNYGGAELTRFYVPLPVFFEGWKSSPRDDIVDYRWDFGDGSAVFHGFNAAHVYENPGTYTCRLTVEDAAGAMASDSLVVQALARDGTTYYVDAQLGSDANPGTSPGAGAWRTATYAFKGMETGRYGPGDQILFKRGQTFDLRGGEVQPGHGAARYGYMFGAHGSGPKPVLQAVGTSDGVVINQDGNGLAHFAMVDLELRMETAGGIRLGELYDGTQESTNLLFLRLDFKNVSRALGFTGSWASDVISGVFVVGCTTYDSEATHVFARAARVALLDNDFDLSGNHIAYLSWVNAGVIANNRFNRPAFGRTALRIDGKGGVFFPTNNVYIADNLFLGWIDPETEGLPHNGGGVRYNYQLLNFSPNFPELQVMTDVVFERNIVTNAETFVLIGDYENLTIRNNLFITNSSYRTERFRLGSDWDLKPIKNIRIVNNTIVTRGSISGGTNPVFALHDYVGPAFQGRTEHEDILIANNIVQVFSGTSRMIYLDTNDAGLRNALTSNNNLYFAPNNPDALFQVGGDAQTGGTLYNLAQWQSFSGKDLDSIYGNPQITDLLGADGIFSGDVFDESLWPMVTSPAVDGGAPIAPIADLAFDFNRDRRPVGNGYDIGAFEQGSILTVNVVGEGRVILDPPSGFTLGQTIELTAEPLLSNWFFTGWSGALTGTANPQSILLDQPKAVTATFAEDIYILVVTVVGPGSVIRSADPPYVFGQEVMLTPVPDPGNVFLAWLHTYVDDIPLTVTMTQPTLVVAWFAEIGTEVPALPVPFFR